MAILDKVIEMQGQGLTNNQIFTRLTNQGISPKEINDSLNQANIKNAVSFPNNFQNSAPQPSQNSQEQKPFPGIGNEMQPSMMPENPNRSPQNFNPEQSQIPTPVPNQSPEVYPPEQQYDPQAQGQDYQSPQNYTDDYYQQTPQAYDEGYYEDYSGGQGGYLDTEVISEVAEQVATEKINEFKQQVGDLVSFKSTMQDRIKDIDDRLKRIENSIDKIQHSVINKIGEFGESSVMIQRDLENLHGTVSKLMNPLVDNYNELKKLNEKK